MGKYAHTPAMQIHYGNVNVVQQLGVELDRVAGRHEDNDLLVQILLQKREQQQEPRLRWADDIALLNAFGSRDILRIKTW
jgi:hypothetical protein